MLYAANLYYVVTVLNAIQGVFKFFNASQNDLSMEHLFGLRIIEGQLLHLFIDKSNILRPKSIVLLDELSKKASIIANKAIPVIFEKNSTHFSKFRKLLDRPWSLQKDLKILPQVNESRNVADLPYTRLNFFHDCVDRLLSDEDGCDVPAKCLNNIFKESRPSLKAYVTQVYFATVMEQHFCATKLGEYLTEYMSNDIADLYAERCSTLLAAVRKITTGYILRDSDVFIFMEIVFVCGQAGFTDFARRSYLDLLLKLQNDEGCFKSRHAEPCDISLTALVVGVLCFYLRVLTDEQVKGIDERFYRWINVDQTTIDLAINFFEQRIIDINKGTISDLENYVLSINYERSDVNVFNNSTKPLISFPTTFLYDGERLEKIFLLVCSCIAVSLFFVVILPKRSFNLLRSRIL